MNMSRVVQIENEISISESAIDKMKMDEELMALVQFEDKLIALLNDRNVPVVDVLDMLARYPATPKELGKRIARLVRLFTPNKNKESTGNRLRDGDSSKSADSALTVREEWSQSFGSKSLDEWLA